MYYVKKTIITATKFMQKKKQLSSPKLDPDETIDDNSFWKYIGWWLNDSVSCFSTTPRP